MKAACIVLTLLIVIAIMGVCVMVKYATDITVTERLRAHEAPGAGISRVARSMAVISLADNVSHVHAQRFPYVAAVIRNSSSSLTFACFASVIQVKWIVTSAHCRKEGASHRVLVYRELCHNYSRMHPVLFWRLHERYNASRPVAHDIAVAKINVEHHPFSVRASVLDSQKAHTVVASIWKTVTAMDKKVYLTNDLAKFHAEVVPYSRCFQAYGIEVDESLICVDFSMYPDDCFVQEFGPLYSGDQIVGVLTVRPKECRTRVAIFTNVSYYAHWLRAATHTTYYG